MWSIIPYLSLTLLVSHVQALYFYIDGPSQKCFFEELPKDTMVVGMVVTILRAKRLQYTNGPNKATSKPPNGTTNPAPMLKTATWYTNPNQSPLHSPFPLTPDSFPPLGHLHLR